MSEVKLVQKLLGELPLDVCDVARLVLESVEVLGKRAQGLSRAELMQLLRRAMRLGAEELLRAEYTVSLAEAAWASVEARESLRPSSRRDLRDFACGGGCGFALAPHDAVAVSPHSGGCFWAEPQQLCEGTGDSARYFCLRN